MVFEEVLHIFKIIELILSAFPLCDFGKLRVEFDYVDIKFFKPIAGRPHWSEENYNCEPLWYRLNCKINVHNGKKKTVGIVM